MAEGQKEVDPAEEFDPAEVDEIIRDLNRMYPPTVEEWEEFKKQHRAKEAEMAPTNSDNGTAGTAQPQGTPGPVPLT